MLQARSPPSTVERANAPSLDVLGVLARHGRHAQTPRRVRARAKRARFPGLRGEGPRVLERPRNLPQDSPRRDPRDGAVEGHVRLLRGAADRQRHAPQRPRPHPVVKDVFPRYKTMRGYDVPRKAGWDTHGLPVEVEVEKELRIHGKADIERYGVKPFIARCIDSRLSLHRRVGEADRADRLLGRPRHGLRHLPPELRRERLVGAVRASQERPALPGHKVVWWWAQGGTALSAAEVGLGYKTVDDPSAFVAFPLRDEPATSLCVWTTTPWTLPSNMFAAVKPTFDYVVVERRRPQLHRRRARFARPREEAEARPAGRAKAFGARARRQALRGRRSPRTTPRRAQDELLAARDASTRTWRVIAGDFVTLDAGTGIVHIAPAFGEDDYDAYRHETAACAIPSLPLFCAVRTGRHLQRRPWAGLRGRAGSRTATRTSSRTSRPAACSSTTSSTATSTRSAGAPTTTRSSSRAPRLVHPTPQLTRTRDREQPCGQLAARAHQGGPLRRLPRQQRRLGAVPRALLGHAPQRLGLREGRGAPARPRERRGDRALNPHAFDALPQAREPRTRP